jgi:uncharacterized protein (DUF2236 family)
MSSAAREAGLSEVLAALPKVRPGRPGDRGLLPPGSVVRRVNSETVLLLGGPRALLLQIARPEVAAGVADHSDFRRNPFERLWQTVGTMLEITFGDTERSSAAAGRVGAVHAAISGEREGRSYQALDPELLLWVHATIVDTGLLCYETFVRPLRPEIRERYYAEMKLIAGAFGVPEQAHPATLADFERYMDESVDRLTVTNEARVLARAILRPPVSPGLRPATATFRLATKGLLPGRIRASYGLKWSMAQATAFRAMAAAARWVLPSLPNSVRKWPHAAETLGRMGENPQVGG